MSFDLIQLHEAPLDELEARARQMGVGEGLRRHDDLVFAIGEKMASDAKQQLGRGVLEVHGEGFGFLRSPADNYLPGQADIYVSQSQIRRFKLQTGDTVFGIVRPPKEGERYLALLRVESVNGDPPGIEAPSFDGLTAIYPDDRVRFGNDTLLDAMDLVAPLGLGQRGMLVAPPRTGRVDLLRRLATALTEDREIDVTVLLIGERPEEIEEWRRASPAEVIATPFDEPAGRHVQVADIAFERARRMVERGDDVVLLVDSLSRLLRACLSELPPAGRDLNGVDVSALHRIRRYMGAARAFEEGGSLTVIGVLSHDPDSTTGRALEDDLRDVVNWELVLNRELADRGVRPAIDVKRSGTLREERLIADDERDAREAFRAALTGDPFGDMDVVLRTVAGPTLDVAAEGQ